MRRINIKCDKIKYQLIIKYLLLYFCRLNTLTGTAKDPTLDLSRLNTLRWTIRKAMGKGWGKNETKIMEGRVTEKKKSLKEEVKEKIVPQSKLHCRATSLTNRGIRLRGQSLYTAVVISSVVLVEFPLNWFLSAISKTGIFPFQC